MSDIEKTDLREAVKNGLKNFKESVSTLDTTSYSDGALGTDAEGKTQQIAEPIATGNDVNVATLAPHSSVAVEGEKKKKSDDEEEVKESVSTKEYLSQLFDDGDLSEEFMEKLSTIFDTALNERISFIEASMQESFNSNLNNQVETLTEELSEKLDEFLTYVVNEWTEENALAIERGIKADVAESFMTGLKSLFETHYIDMPDEKVDVVEELLSAKAELESNLNEQIETNINLLNETIDTKAQGIFNELCSDMTDVEAERFHGLIENIEFEDTNSYKNRLSIVKESFLSSHKPRETTDTLVETIVEKDSPDSTSSLLEAYSEAISFQNRNK
jgi:hypothetical protein